MPGPIDDALKHLTELSPQDWVVRGGWPAAAVALIDADIGTIATRNDFVMAKALLPCYKEGTRKHVWSSLWTFPTR